jgi:hypothetical protein
MCTHRLPSPFSRSPSSLPPTPGVPHARAVLVDSEPKALRWATEASSPAAPLFDPRGQVVCSNSGRGNNWAFGYSNQKRKSAARQAQEELETRMRQASIHDRSAGGGGGGGSATKKRGGNTNPPSSSARPQWVTPQLIAAEKGNAEIEGSVVERAVESIRREAERCDSVIDLLLLHSVSGGTGSGLGSRLLQTMRETLFPKNYILAASVFPFAEGDTPLQAYNAALTLKWLQRHADGVCAFHNDDLLASLGGSGGAAASSRLSSSRGPRATLSDINAQIANTLMGLLWPSLARFAAPPEGLSRIQDLIVQVIFYIGNMLLLHDRFARID